MILEQINGPEGLKVLPSEDLEILTQGIRTFLIEKTSYIGGHLVSNLDVVGLTITLFKALNLPEDRIIWDVGHQSYTHKILNGRMAELGELRQYGGPNGFPKRKGSPCDPFGIDRSSTPISTELGIALGRDIRGKDYRMVSVIGDGALTGGMTYKALNNVVRMKKNFIIALNDNKMSISENVGGMSRYLNGLYVGNSYNDPKKSVADALDRIPVADIATMDKTKHTKDSIKQLFIPGMLFENMGITHLGLADGHNIQTLYKVPREVQKLDHVVLVHVMTKKGKGYRPTERNPSYFHGVDPFDVKTGKSLSVQTNPSHTNMFSRKLCQLGEEHPELVTTTTAIPDGTGLAAFGKKLPDRFFGVGIAEVHAVASAAGIAVAGFRPVVAIYSSFLQRTCDQVLHDVCIQNLLVLFAMDRAGLMGSDGETHQGTPDYSFLTSVPSMSIIAPRNLWEPRAMLDFAMDYDNPLAIRYPGGEACCGLKEFRQPISHGAGEILHEEEDIALLAVGNMVSTGECVWQKLKAEGHRCNPANGGLVKSFDRKTVPHLAKRHHLTVTMEENVFQGGYGLVVIAFIHENYLEVKALNVTIPDAYVEHGNVSILREGSGIDSDSIIGTMKAGGCIGQETLGIRPAPDRKETWI